METPNSRYRKTFSGKIRTMWSSMNHRTGKCYENVKVLITREDFIAFIENDKNYKRIFDEWVLSNYKRNITPTIDRIDSKGDYVKSNIQVLTSADNAKKVFLQRTPRTHCKKGHELIGTNIAKNILYRRVYPGICCRICYNEYQRSWKRKNKIYEKAITL